MGAPLLEIEGAPDGANGVLEAPLHVAVQQRRLAHVHVAQQHHLSVGLHVDPPGVMAQPRPPGAPGVPRRREAELRFRSPPRAEVKKGKGGPQDDRRRKPYGESRTLAGALNGGSRTRLLLSGTRLSNYR